MAKQSISSLLSMQKSLLTRRNQLEALEKECATEKRYFEPERTITPKYLVQNIDRMITKINKTLFSIDQRIKESNARTKIDIDIDYDMLMSPIK